MSRDTALENLAQQPQQQLQNPAVAETAAGRVQFSPQAGIETTPLQPPSARRSRSESKNPLPPAPLESLILLPEVAQTGRPAGSGRPFQRRRRSRACDACRARKTKCDTPDEGPCSACAAASLVCRFSEGGEDRRRSVPARRIRSLEAQVTELTKKLRDAKALLGSGAGPLVHGDRRSISPSVSSSPRFPPSSSSFAGSTIGSAAGQLENNVDLQQNFQPGDWWKPLHTDTCTPTSATGDHFRGGMPFGPPGHNPLPINSHGSSEFLRPRSSGSSRYLLDSNPPFIASYKAYLRQLGYPAPGPDYPPGQHQQTIHVNQPSPRVPLLSEYPSITSTTLPLDLRVLLPPRPFAERLREVFRRTIQNYTPLFYWPSFLEEKFDRAWAGPMWEEDSSVVKGVFCIIQMMLAVASQMVEESQEMAELSGEADLQERTGWKFFHLGRKYADLNSPAYSSDDALFLLLMSMYLDNASLPSPAWMITGAMARVCQDVSLDKNPPPNMFSEVELESRRRLFWVAYIQERKACLKKARRVILHDRDIEIQLPKAFEGDGSHSLAGEGGGDASNLRLPQEYSGSVVNSTSLTSENSLQVMIAQIHISMLCTSLINVHITDNGGMQDLQRVQELDEKLKKAWDRFPPNLTDLQNLDPLDMGAIRPLFYLQYCRLLLYRFFTESSDPPLNPDFRTFCLAQSIQVSKISAHLIFRASRNDWFDKCFGLCTEELVHLQTFRAAVILLLVHCTREPALLTVTKEEVEICVRALLSIASFHSQGRRLLDVFDSFARTFGYESGNNNPSQQTNRSSTKSAAPNNANPPTPSPGSAASVAAAVAAAELDSFLPPPPPPSGQRWEFDGQNYAAHSSNNPPQPQGFGNHFVPPSVSEWPDGPGEFRFAGFGSEMEVGRDRDDGVGDVRVDWDAVQQALQFGDTAQGVGGGMSGGGPTQTGYWGF